MATVFGNYELKAIQENEELREEFLEQIIQEYSQSILWLAYTYVKEEQLAEEIMQDVFFTCYNKIDLFKNQSTIKTWMYRITSNKCKDHLRKKTLKSFLSKKDLDHDGWQVNKNHPESIMFQKVEDENLAANVMALPAKFKEVIYFYYFEGLKIKEISETLAIKGKYSKNKIDSW